MHVSSNLYNKKIKNLKKEYPKINKTKIIPIMMIMMILWKLIILLFLPEENSKILMIILMVLNNKKIKNLKKFMVNGNY